MDGRKALILAVGILCGLAGCSKPITNPFSSSSPPPPPSAAQLPPPEVKITKREDLGDPKPATWVQWGALKAEIAVDPNRPAAERELYAQQAKEAYAKALKGDAKYVPAHMGLGELNESLGDREEAVANYRTALKCDPKNVSAHISIARVLEGAGKRDEALATYVIATSALPKDASLWFEMGMCRGRAKQFDQALSCLVRASELRPKNPDYAKSVGFMLARMGRTDEALTWLTKVMPEADARYNLARMMAHIGNAESSREQLSGALRLEPEHLAALKMASESQPSKAGDQVQNANVRADDPQTAIHTTSTLPTRPMVIQTANNSEPRRLPPLIPVLSEPFDPKPTPQPLTTATPKSETKRPTITIGFDANP
jgi:tetratricopeptide (TPR) repeat protein